SLIVFLTVYYFLKKYFENESRKRTHQTLLKNQDVITPLRLQAYERIVIYLERISPESLLLRVNKPGYTCKQLQTELLNTIRIEWEHNLSQQIYITQKSWEVARNAKSNMIQLINISAEKIKEDSPSLNLSKEIFSSFMDKEKIYTTEAIKFIKEEMNSMFY
ncbi:MAG: hypothetical protein JSV22_00825, partial [Bacteroidales bacterium]